MGRDRGKRDGEGGEGWGNGERWGREERLFNS